jgi:alkanesulfonate monooxygenase SsuD/methylene tetrahydromethanopterin reductase-like flavin-dependent oxidoreductase (luciferase family)
VDEHRFLTVDDYEPVARERLPRDAYDYYAGHLDSRAEHTAYLTAELIDDFALAGPPERCLARLRELAELGVGEVSCAYLNGELEQMELVGHEIIARLP